MGSVAVTFRVMPESLDIDIGDLKGRVRGALGPAFRSMEERPVAFGLKAVLAIAIVDDASGAADLLEQTLSAAPGVGSVEIVDVTLV